MNSHKLILEYEYDFELIGIVSGVREYNLAWHINKKLEIDLKKEVDLIYKGNKNSDFLISNFIFEDEYNSFRLLKNRAIYSFDNLNLFLLPELKKIDYFVMLTGNFSNYASTFRSKIKEISVVELAQTIDYQNLKSKENLILN